MTIYLDDEAISLPAGLNLDALLAQLQRAPASVATARNGEFVAREARADTLLVDGDRILLFKPIVGG